MGWEVLIGSQRLRLFLKMKGYLVRESWAWWKGIFLEDTVKLDLDWKLSLFALELRL